MFVRMITASLVRRRSRMIIAMLAIIVGATILSGLELIYNDVPRQMSAQFRVYGANIILTPTGNGEMTHDEIEKAIAYFPARELEGFTPYRYENSRIHNMPVTLAAIDFESVARTSPYWHINGAMPTQDSQVLVGAKVANRLAISTGDSVTLENSFEITKHTDTTLIPSYEIYTDPETGEVFCDHQLELEVTGILETGGSEEEYVYVTFHDVEYITLSSRSFDIVEVSVASTQENLYRYIARINENMDTLTAKPVKRVTASEGSVLTKLKSLVLIVTIVVLILTMICVATTMTAVIAERRSEIGLRKVLGASNQSIMIQFLCEGLLLGGFGGIIGSVLGFFFAQYVSMNVFSSSVSFQPLLVVVTIIVSVLVTGVACLIPIRSAVNVDPALVLKGE